jgi:hypothetical protein
MFTFLKYFHRTPDAPTPARPVFDLESFQWSRFSEDTASGCVLCTIDPQDSKRLKQIIGVLPVGLKVQLPVISQIVGVNFKTISSDLRVLIHQLRLPIKWNRQGIMLTAPVFLCKHCAQTGERIRATEQFKKRFRAAATARIEDSHLLHRQERREAVRSMAGQRIGSASPP